MSIDRILLINPPYDIIGVKESVSSVSITLSIAMLAAIARELDKEVLILDLNLSEDWETQINVLIEQYIPDLVAITFTTPIIGIAGRIAQRTRELMGDEVLIVGGGAHATARPDETLRQTVFDALAIGEAETSFGQFLRKGSFAGIPGWIYKSRGDIFSTGTAESVENLDDLPFAAIELFSVEEYIYPSESARENPVCLLETSRGCYSRCIFCNKNIFGHRIRRKSARRVVSEMEYILSKGFREIHLADDLFTADMQHAISVCQEILNRDLRFPWVPRSGIRVDRISPTLLDLMRQAGCYHVPFGIESGNQEILNSIKKGITVEQIRDAVSMAKSAGMETTGYFMVGLPGETRETILQTTDFAFELELDHVKFGFAVPLPGTPFFDQLYQSGRLATLDWERYTYSTPPWEIYDHPTLDKSTLEQMMIGTQRIVQIANRTIHPKKI